MSRSAPWFIPLADLDCHASLLHNIEFRHFCGLERVVRITIRDSDAAMFSV